MSSNNDNLQYAVEGVLIPGLLIFLTGWLVGQAGILNAQSVGALNLTLLYFILATAVFSNFTGYALTGKDFLFFVPNILDKLLMAIPSFLLFAWEKKYDIKKACCLWLNGIYSNALSYGNYFLYVFYKQPVIPTYCSLSATPDNILFFPVIIFIIEYVDAKAKLAEELKNDPNARAPSKGKMILSIILRVLKNPIVWACFSGLIFNIIVFQTGGKFWTWVSRFSALGAQCSLGITMFTTGLFTATYPPINDPIIKFLCCLVSPIRSLCSKKQDPYQQEMAETSLIQYNPSGGNAEQGFGGGEKNNEQTSAPTSATTSSSPATPPAAAPYKLNWLLILFNIICRHIAPSFLTMGILAIFGSTFSTLQKHALILIASLGTPGVPFNVGRLYNLYPGESAVTQVLGAFVLSLPAFLLFYYLVNSIWPLE